MATPDRASSIKYLEKRFGKGIVMDLDSVPDRKPSITTGHPAIDWVMGCGGFPFGMHVELYGMESSGKSTLSILVAAQCQQLKYNTGCVLYMDFENTLDLSYARRLGLKTDRDSLLVSQPEDAEQGLEIMRELIDNELVDLIIVDSVAAMLPSAETAIWEKEGNKGKQTGEMGHTQIGSQSRMMSQGLKQLSHRISTKKVCVIWINQIRTKIGTGGRQTTTTTTGGNALKFYAAVRLELVKTGALKGKLFNPWENKTVEGIVGMHVKVKSAKNKAAPPFREAPILIRFGTGIDVEFTILDYACKTGFLKKGNTGWYTTSDIGASRNARGLEDFRKLMKEEPKIWEKIVAHCDFDKVNQATLEVLMDEGEEPAPDPAISALLGQVSAFSETVADGEDAHPEPEVDSDP